MRRARGWAANHASGNNSASRSIGWVGSRSGTSLRYANGSPPSRLQLATKLYGVAAVRPPRSLPTNKKFFRLCGGQHNRNYAGLGIMRSPARHTAPRPLVSASTGPTTRWLGSA